MSASSNGQGTAVLDVPVQPAETDAKLDAAREKLLALRRQAEELEKQKAELEELRRKQDEYVRGKTEMIENLTRALVVLENDQLAAQRRVEACENTTTAFKDYLEQLQAIHDAEWTAGTVRAELSHALGIIEHARLEYNRARAKLECLNPALNQPVATVAPNHDADWQETLRYIRLGAAASAPLILAGTIWLILLLAFQR
jgi:chromosome segregation ATPase